MNSDKRKTLVNKLSSALCLSLLIFGGGTPTFLRAETASPIPILQIKAQQTASTATKQAVGRKPNVLIMMADDLGYGDVSCLARHVVPTPNIDRLAKAGVKFTEGYVTSPLCAPSRAGFLSGRYNETFGVQDNGLNGMPKDVRIFPEIFSQAGYKTGLLGKWHPGENKPGLRPFDRGFQEFYGYYSPLTKYNPPHSLWRNDKLVPEKEYSTDAFAREAEDFIERHKNEPFYLNVAFNAPHIQGVIKGAKLIEADYDRACAEGKILDVPKIRTARPGEAAKLQSQFPGDTARADTVATIIALDQAVGRILDKLEQTGLAKNTIIFFLSDNGGHPENRSENLPLYQYKWSVYEGGFRVPFFAVYPGVFPAGLTYNQPVMSFDILPTCAALAGVPVPTNLDGVNLVPYLKAENPEAPHEILCWRIDDRWAIRKGPWKLLSNEPGEIRLYSMADDFEEKHDVASAHPEVVAELQRVWQDWNSHLPPALKRTPQNKQKDSE